MDSIKEILDHNLPGVAPSKIEMLAGKLRRLPVERARIMLDAGLLLVGSSARAAIEFLWHSPDVARQLPLDDVRVWGKIARHLVHGHADGAIRFFQSAAPVLQSLPASVRSLVLGVCERQTTMSPPLAIDCFMAAPQLISHINDQHVATRLYAIAYEISRRSATQSAELLKAAPRVLAFLRAEHRGPIRKPAQDRQQSNEEQHQLIDEVLALTEAFAQRAGGLATEFFATLPQALPETPVPLQMTLLHATRCFLERGGGAALQYFLVAGRLLVSAGPGALSRWTALAQKIAVQGNAAVYHFLKVTPPVITALVALGRHRADAFTSGVLDVVNEIADENISLAIECFKSSPTALQSSSLEQFARWAHAGLRLRQRDMRHAQAYYALETKSSQQSLSQLTGGLSLDKVLNTLRLYIEGLAGQEIMVKPSPTFALSRLPDELRLHEAATVYLPSLIHEFEDEASNFRIYKALAAHMAGHIEFGTYATDTPPLQSVMTRIQADGLQQHAPSTSAQPDAEPISYATVLSQFPDREWAMRVFSTLEMARIHQQLRRVYRGLRDDLDLFQTRLRQHRPHLDTMSADQLLVEFLFQLTLCGECSKTLYAMFAPLAPRLQDIFTQTIYRPEATVADTLLAVYHIHQLVAGGRQQPSESLDSDQRASQAETQPEPQSMSENMASIHEDALGDRADHIQDIHADPSQSWMELMGKRLPSTLHSQLWSNHNLPEEYALEPGDQVYFYDEWDRELGDYRADWCRVVQKSARRGGQQFVQYVRSYYGPMIGSIKRQFQLLRPEALRRIRGELDGEEFDLQAVIDYALDRRTSGRVSERLYVRRLRKQRDVAVSFLLDMSSSTARTVGPARAERGRVAKRIIDIEKEGLVLMSEALEAVGDIYSIQGFTSEGRHHVKFFVIKDFEEPYGAEIESRIGGITYQNNTRLGAAIRHATARLKRQTAHTKLLIVLSDGRPYDHDYGDARYARDDTKVALRQARLDGIIPFCITIDRESEPQLRDMYGEVGYTIIDDILHLPERLPGIYRRLTQ